MPGWRYADASACLRSGPSSSWVFVNLSRRGSQEVRAYGEAVFLLIQPSGRLWAVEAVGWLPGSLGHTGKLTAVSHFPDAHPAEAELAIDRVRPAAALATGVSTHSELRLRGSLEDQRLLGHAQFSLNGKPRSLSSARPSSSVVAVVTTVMSMPRVRSIRSWSISWNTDCSVSPNV